MYISQLFIEGLAAKVAGVFTAASFGGAGYGGYRVLKNMDDEEKRKKEEEKKKGKTK